MTSRRVAQQVEPVAHNGLGVGSSPAALITMRRMVLPFKQGDVTLHFPAELSAADLEDIEMWFDLLLRSMRRQAARPPSSMEEHEPSKLGVEGSSPSAVATCIVD